MKVKVLKLGHSAQQVELPAGSTVQDALDKADIDADGYSLSVNGLGVSAGAAVTDADVICLIPKIEGGTI
jgi:sulfur carrier protein ThiS